MPEQFLQINLAHHTLGMNATDISRIIPMVALVTPPDSPLEIEGFLNIGGEYGTVFNLWSLLSVTSPPVSVHDYLVIFSCPEETCFGAFRIDGLPAIIPGHIITHPAIDETLFAGCANTLEGQLLIIKPAFFFTDSLKLQALTLIQSLAEIDRQFGSEMVEGIR